MPLEEAREYSRSLGLNDKEEWYEYWKSHERPEDIPARPDVAYKEWESWGDFFGTGPIAPQNRKFRPFKEAREYAHSLNFENKEGWDNLSKQGKIPKDIPIHPDRTYKKEWKGWGDWLDTGTIATFNRKYCSFEEAREFARSLGLKGADDWDKYWKSHKKPDDIPASPEDRYKEEWISWYDFLGNEETVWSIRRIKETLKGLIDSGIIYQMDEARLYSLMKSDGLLNLYSTNRHSELFKKLPYELDNPEFIKALDQYAHSDSEELPEVLSHEKPDYEEEIKTAKTIEELANGKDELDYGKIATPEQVFKETEALPSICVDEEKIQFQISCSVRDLWKTVIENEAINVAKIKAEGKNGNRFHDEVKETFLSEYEQVQQIRRKLPEGYAFPSNPRTMQLYVAMRIKKNPYFANLSTTGTGKTLSAILASRVIDAKMTVVVCPNDIVKQWEEQIKKAFPDSDVKSSRIYEKEVFNEKRDENKHKYLVINYDKFSQYYSDNELSKLAEQKIDLLILDEVQYAKKRSEAEESKRHRLVLAFRMAMKKRNKDSKALGMSATPIINDLTEGKAFLEMLIGNDYVDLETRDTIPNAVALYEKLVPISIRERQSYATVETHDIDVQVPYEGLTRKEYTKLKSNPLHVEKMLTPARIPEIIKNIDGKTIIYTEYVGEGMVQELKKAVEKAGYSTTEYTGEDKRGFEEFVKNGKQVLIASKPISVGVDGLQTVCNRLIINTLPWTNSGYEQLIGRLAREKQTNKVDVFLIKASLGPVQYDETYKMGRIRYKRTVADCAVDGILPRKKMVTPTQANKAAIEMLERLNRGEISTVNRPEISIELTPTEIETRIAHMGEISKIHQKFNTERSETTHERLKNNPEELIEYHRLLAEKQDVWRKTHGIVPYEVIIEKIKKFPSRMLQTIKIADFGCGKAFLVKEFGKDRMYSFDHIEYENVTSCDMSHTGLSDGDIDVAVFSQSLMGVNWPDYIKEAKRCLAKNGYLFIGEATDQLENGRRLSTLLDVIRKEGFVITSEEQRAEFTFIEARKL